MEGFFPPFHMKYTVIFLLFLQAKANFNIKIQSINELRVNQDKIAYKIQAKSKSISSNTKSLNLFLNKEKFASEHSFYLDGNLSAKDLFVSFKKAYFLEGKFIMLEVKGSYKDNVFSAPKASFTHKKLNLQNCFIRSKDKKARRLKHSFTLR